MPEKEKNQSDLIPQAMGIQITKDQLERIDAVAKQNGTTRSQTIRNCLEFGRPIQEQLIAEYTEKRRQLEEQLKSGQFCPFSPDSARKGEELTQEKSEENPSA